jgi:WD40 repeat protein
VNAIACTTLNGNPVAVSGSRDRTIRIWDLTAQEPLGEPLTGHTDTVNAIACTTLNGNPIAVSGSRDHTVRIWDIAEGRELGVFRMTDTVIAVDVRPVSDGSLVLLVGFGHEVALLHWEPR